ncbi:GntR family transcriptional regulator [Streptomyces sp. IBSBF 2950]|uniref:GntR family transcriptional regulator n=1 Tax=Streptomyces sp. IBSBF 2950 TaxID=2903528 RepID=UPI002FDC2425
MADAAAYRRVAESVRAKIEGGDYADNPERRLPSVETIAKDHGVSKQTAHNAIQSLAISGLLHVVRRQGAYVRERPRDRAVVRDRTVYRDAIGYFFDKNAQDWRAVSPPTHGIAPAPDHIADLLGVPRGENVLIRDRDMGPAESDQALQVATSYISLQVVAEIPVIGGSDTGPGGIYDRIEEHFNAPLEWHETVSARLSNVAEQDRLTVAPTAAVLVVTREARVRREDGSYVVAEVNETSMPADQFAVSYAVQRDPSAPWPRGEGESVT